ncbi:MAG: 3-deoxy-D-manno-octulosonic acid transferase [Robiginitomaculum sp.]|nr:3-deoxy-D-manno-octulosonic acid transferase [Robiginitomaculum sp.]
MKRPFSLWLYLCLSHWFGWLYRSLIAVRVWQGKEDRARIKERFGKASAIRPNGQLVWIHGASVGECILALALAEKLRGARSDLSFLFTSGTRTSAKLLVDAGHLHQFLPVDTPTAMRRFVSHWRPDLVILLESEIWPNLLNSVKATDTPLVLVNARLNTGSRNKWTKRPRLSKALFEQFNWISAADQPTADFVSQLTGKMPPMLGNLKLLATPAQDEPAWVQQLQNTIAARPVWLAASIHAYEDEVIIEAHRKVIEQQPNALLILAPRHPERGEKIAALCSKAGFSNTRWSQQQPPTGAVFIADTIGDMQAWLSLATIVFVGGSIGAGTGHNPLEAVRANLPVISGKYVASFADIYQALDKLSAVQWVTNASELADAVLHPPTNAQTLAATHWLQQAADGLGQQVRVALLSYLDEKHDAPT